jgi:periplasmic protein TonB
MSATFPYAVNTSRRNLLIAGSVVLFHAAALWALQSGLMRRTVEVIVPVALLSEIVTPPAPRVETPPAPQPAPEPPRKVVKTPPPPPAPRPAPRPIARPETAAQPAPAAPVGVIEPQPAAPPVTVPQAAAASPPATAPAPAPPRMELPSSSAEYLQNPKPPYPPMSKRLGEQGKVVLRVLIGADGRAQDAQVKESSGYGRLDRTARETVLQWRYVPGKRGGVAEAMWFDVPINFVLE